MLILSRRHPVLQAFQATLLVFLAIVAGCASKPALTQTGFLSDYSQLTPVDSDRMRYESPAATQYQRFVVQPVPILVPAGTFASDELAELARYFRPAFEDGTGVGSVRLALEQPYPTRSVYPQCRKQLTASVGVI